MINNTEADTNLHDALADMALALYAGEMCRICGKPITREDIDNDAVFAGYNEDDSSRTAHKECWEAQSPCPSCGQIDQGQTGEHPCPECGLPRLWDDREG